MGIVGGRSVRIGASLLVAVVLAAEAGAQEPIGGREPVLGRDRAPVLLVPGWGDGAADIAPFRRRLLDGGWSAAWVRAVSFSNPVGSNEANAREIAGAVEMLRRLTGSERIDVVAHSMGGLALREYLRTSEAGGAVRRVVFLGTPHRGTIAAMLAWGDGGRQMVPGSDFLERLNREEEFPEGMEVLSVRSPLDLRVIPGSSAMHPGARNVEICCPTHVGMLDDPRAFEEVRRFLLYGVAELTSPDGTIPLRTVPRR